MSKKQTVFNLLFLVVVFGLTMYLVFRGKDIGDIISTAREADARYLLLSIVCVVLFILGESVIIFYMMRTLGTSVKMGHCALYSFVGFFFSCITPSASGGQPMQIFYMKKDKLPIPVTTLVLMIVTIYRETVTEFLRQIVSSAFSGESLTEQETQEKLAAILMEKSDSLEDKFSEADITYPMIKVDGQWKVTSLDDETVKIMSANFKSVEDEISQTLSASSEEADGSSSENAQAPAASDGTIDLSNERFSIHYTRNVVSTDFGGEPCLLVYYDYTNNGSGASSAMVDVNLTAYQNGASLEAAIPANSDSAIDAFMKEIQPGETVNVCQAFSLKDMSPVTLQAVDAFGLDTSVTAVQTLNLQ